MSYFAFDLIEYIYKKPVFSSSNMNSILIIIFISGLITILYQDKLEHDKEVLIKNIKKAYILIFMLGIMGGLIVNYEIQSLGILSIIISSISSLIIILLSILVLIDE